MTIGAAPIELGHAVARQHRGQPLAELLVQAVALHVEALQVGVEVLAGAVHAELGVQLLARGTVAAQLGEVGEEVQQVDLAADHVVPGHGEPIDGTRAAAILREDRAYLLALRERGAEAKLPLARRSAAQRAIHAENAGRVAG